jgi:hypothetical protein
MGKKKEVTAYLTAELRRWSLLKAVQILEALHIRAASSHTHPGAAPPVKDIALPFDFLFFFANTNKFLYILSAFHNTVEIIISETTVNSGTTGLPSMYVVESGTRYNVSTGDKQQKTGQVTTRPA